MPEVFTCPRRREDGMEVAGARGRGGPNLDSYEIRRGDDWGTCTYCGSISPEKLMEFVAAGVEVGPCDKSYKFYLDVPNPDPSKLFVHSAVGGGTKTEPPKPLFNGDQPYIEWKDLTPEQLEIAERDGFGPMKGYDPPHYISFGTNTTLHAKFYTPHFELNRELGSEFAQLWIDKKIRWGYPGYPYVKLYLPQLPMKVEDPEPTKE